jgi:hypothetical protein
MRVVQWRLRMMFLFNVWQSWRNFHFWRLVALTILFSSQIPHGPHQKEIMASCWTLGFIMTMPDHMLRTLSYSFWQVKAFCVQPVSSALQLLAVPYTKWKLRVQRFQATAAAVKAVETILRMSKNGPLMSGKKRGDKFVEFRKAYLERERTHNDSEWRRYVL